MKEIPLTKGYVALVDDEDYDDLAQYNWRASVEPRNAYAQRTVRLADGRRTSERMHRRLLPGVAEVDHVNGNGLDNRRVNLRPATRSENLRNRSGPRAGNASGFRGVYWHQQKRRWHATISIDGRRRHLGYFVDIENAARAFDAAARKYFGKFHGYLNFPNPALDGTP